MDSRIWCIIRPNYKRGLLKNIGLMGTGFFISKKEFITAYHVLNDSCFKPNSDYNNKEVLLLNSEGKILRINSNSKIEYYEKKDITKIEFLDKKFEFFKIGLNVNEGDFVENFGFPSNKIDEIIEFENNSFKIKKISKQNGKILKIFHDFTCVSNDVNIIKKTAIVTNYGSQIGFSGGSLLKNNKVVGIMSMMIPPGNGKYSKKSVAISSLDF